MPKSTNTEYNRRVFEVRIMLLESYKRFDIIQYITDKTNWNVKERQIDKYIAEARELDKEDVLKDFEAKRANMIAKLELIHKNALSDKDYSNARGVLKQISDIEGLNAPKKLDVGITGDTILGGLIDKYKNEG